MDYFLGRTSSTHNSPAPVTCLNLSHRLDWGPMLRLFYLCIVLMIISPLHADEIVHAAQAKLSKLGYYSGKADGEMGSRTSAAIRRYQIAENLKVTGELNRQTLQHLGISGKAPTPAYVALADIFKGGPYILAGPEKQIATVRKAQQNLKLLGYYRGPQDGMPNASLVSAVKAWQKNAGFRQTGRFDENTLKGLDLMPDSDGSCNSSSDAVGWLPWGIIGWIPFIAFGW